MDTQNEVKIISMLGEMNNKITDISLNIKDIRERMNKNFSLLVDAEMVTSDKLDGISKIVEDIDFRLKVAEAGIGLNSQKIKEFNKVK